MALRQAGTSYLSRQSFAEFLLGFFALPLCLLFGGMEALLFKAGPVAEVITVLVVAAIPIIGAVRTRQRTLLAGLLAGGVASILFCFAVHHG